MTPQTAPTIAIACGGTGGHLFPGLAVAEQLVRRGGRVTLLISPKEVDRQAVKNVSEMEILTLPAVGLADGKIFSFAGGFIKSYRTAKKSFAKTPPHAVLAMGGFTGAPPVLAAKKFGAKTFLHESNTIPGRANRWLSRVIDHAFAGFPETVSRLHARKVTVTGTPVRSEFRPLDAVQCRAELGLDPAQPVLLVMGGSQGATGINNLVLNSLEKFPAGLQFIHFAGANDADRARRAYAGKNLRAFVQPFFDQMEIALGAATIAISRAGASSLAEIAAMRLPSILIPFPAATDNHQFFNARAFEETGAARRLEQKSATPQLLADMASELISNADARAKMQSALGNWHTPGSAEQIAAGILNAAVGSTAEVAKGVPSPKSNRPGAFDRQQFSKA